MGTTNLKSIQFTADGFLSKVGEQYDLTTDWPRLEVSEYTRTIDFDTKYMRRTITKSREATLRTAIRQCRRTTSQTS